MKRLKKIFINNFIFIYIIYYITIFLDSTALVVDYKFLVNIVKVVRYFTYLLFLIRLLFLLPEYKKIIFGTKWKDKPKITKAFYIVTIIMIIGLMISAVVTTNRRNLFIIFILICSLNVDYKKIFKTTMYLQMILTTILVTLCLFGITQDYTTGRGIILRHSLGFVYTTNIVQMFMFSLILYIYDKGSKVTYKEILVMQFINLLLFALTNTRTEFIFVEAILIILVSIKLLKKKNKETIINKTKKWYSNVFSHTAMFLPILSFNLVMGYSLGGIFYKINGFLSNRLKQTYDCFMQYDVTLFGTKIEFIGYGLRQKIEYGLYHMSNYVDNEYMQLMLSEGLVFIVCFTIIIELLLLVLHKKGKYKEVILCSIVLLFGLMNPRIVNLLYSPILFMIIPTFVEFGNKTKEEMK